MTQAPDYGIDAPGVRRAMVGSGAAGAVIAAAATAFAARLSGPLSTLSTIVAAAAGLAAVYGFGMAAYMTYCSRVGKLRTRERLLDLAQAVAPWTGGEAVLDVGCGRGLMMIGAALRLTTGKATGIDLWRAEDQAGSTPEAARENARLEGVADRVVVETGDARALPFADATFDAVLSHWVVHNLPDSADRSLALREMARVLRPGGVLVVADIAHHAAYRDQLAALGFGNLREIAGGPAARLIGLLSGGSFRPAALVGRRPRRSTPQPLSSHVPRT